MGLVETCVQEFGRVINVVVGSILFMATIVAIPFGFLVLLMIQGLIKLLDIVIRRLDRR